MDVNGRSYFNQLEKWLTDFIFNKKFFYLNYKELMDSYKVMTNLLPGYVVGAGGCVERATVAVILTEERTSVLKSALSF